MVKTKILSILHFPPPIHGSAIVGAYFKESKQINNAFEIRYINLGTSGSVQEIGKTNILKFIRYLSLIWNTIKQLYLFKPDLCYLTPNSKGFGFYKDFIIIVIVKLFRNKMVFHFHNKGVSDNQEKFFDNHLYRYAFENTYVILLSEYLFVDVQKYVKRDNVFFCSNGIHDISHSQQNNLKNEHEGKVTILFYSNLFISKGVLVLIDACKLLIEKNIIFHCVIAGGDADLTKEKLTDLINNNNLDKTVEVHGFINNKEINKVFDIADIFVHPTFNDCQPLVLLEAMRKSLPIISTTEGAIPDLVLDGTNGFLVHPRDARELAEKIEILITNPDIRIKMGNAGRSRFEQFFTLEKFENRMIDILGNITK